MKSTAIHHLMNDYLDNHTLVKAWRWQEVLTAIPMNFDYADELTEDVVLEKVKAVANALEAVYVHDSDAGEMGISYTINYRRQYVNA